MAGRTRKYGKKSKRIGYRRTRGHKHMGGYKRTRKGQTKRMVKRRGKRTRKLKGGNDAIHKAKEMQQRRLLKAVNDEGYYIDTNAYVNIEEKLYNISSNIDDEKKANKAGKFLDELESTAENYHSSGKIIPFIEALSFAAKFTGDDIFIPHYGESTPTPIYDDPFTSTASEMGTYVDLGKSTSPYYHTASSKKFNDPVDYYTAINDD